ncbi:thioredoxin reductase [Candidatus Epulonipiscium fishelsonii]|uniref:Thioredoxin reductase n=1 Tax=Candidatus Epulonipiscium fishelsonii TaxID=77094 RepID=A0ACC8XCA7_9FIRM|nr:thioredoxin reductase [Epulopiscium sp. SCG-B11WGA-EpuloA1]ONI42475.1 thioredoxin reductase [Epulopiscium sp. SCG-B05WGA-EpuloA1]
MLDIAIVGAGPAGLSAGINAKIRNKNIKVFGNPFNTSYAYKAERIDNYLGMYGISGQDLIKSFVEHANKMELEIHQGRVLEIYDMSGTYTLNVDNEFFETKTVILANGVTMDKSLEGEAKFLGKGVSYCATCDGPLYRGKTVALIGDSPIAEEDVNYLSEVCEKVYYIPTYKDINKVNDQVEILKDKPTAIVGDEIVESLKLKDKDLDVSGVFIIKESVPTTRLLQGLEIENNTIKVNRFMETNLKGVYAAGDCTGKPFQVSKSVGEGTTAGLQAVKYLDSNK